MVRRGFLEALPHVTALQRKNPAALSDDGVWETVSKAAYFFFASSRSLAALMTSSETFFGQGA
jgi:hypothetical protein